MNTLLVIGLGYSAKEIARRLEQIQQKWTPDLRENNELEHIRDLTKNGYALKTGGWRIIGTSRSSETRCWTR